MLTLGQKLLLHINMHPDDIYTMILRIIKSLIVDFLIILIIVKKGKNIKENSLDTFVVVYISI